MAAQMTGGKGNVCGMIFNSVSRLLCVLEMKEQSHWQDDIFPEDHLIILGLALPSINTTPTMSKMHFTKSYNLSELP
jgi:hypothetical protein